MKNIPETRRAHYQRFYSTIFILIFSFKLKKTRIKTYANLR
jgi:hypothetical protein